MYSRRIITSLKGTRRSPLLSPISAPPSAHPKLRARIIDRGTVSTFHVNGRNEFRNTTNNTVARITIFRPAAFDHASAKFRFTERFAVTGVYIFRVVSGFNA